MYSLLENYIKLVFENEQEKPKSFEEVLKSIEKENEDNTSSSNNNTSTEPSSSVAKPNATVPSDPYYWLRPGYKPN